jgi:hypothetical protein
MKVTVAHYSAPSPILERIGPYGTGSPVSVAFYTLTGVLVTESNVVLKGQCLDNSDLLTSARFPRQLRLSAA